MADAMPAAPPSDPAFAAAAWWVRHAVVNANAQNAPGGARGLAPGVAGRLRHAIARRLDASPGVIRVSADGEPCRLLREALAEAEDDVLDRHDPGALFTFGTTVVTAERVTAETGVGTCAVYDLRGQPPLVAAVPIFDGVVDLPTPLHAVIGPNGCGKTSLLSAARRQAMRAGLFAFHLGKDAGQALRAPWEEFEASLRVRFPQHGFARHPDPGSPLVSLLWLAYLPPQPRCLLTADNPTAGLHPAMAREFARGLRRLVAQGWQVLLATHDPLLLNELDGDEVTLMVRGAAGLRTARMSQTVDYAERAKVYHLGELWVSYCDGDSEAQLMPADPRAAT